MRLKKRLTGKVPCQARVIPMHEKGMRPCGLTPTSELDGRNLCDRHLAIAKRRAAARAGAKP